MVARGSEARSAAAEFRVLQRHKHCQGLDLHEGIPPRRAKEKGALEISENVLDDFRERTSHLLFTVHRETP